MTLASIRVATKDGMVDLIGEQCTEHLAIVPNFVTSVATGSRMFTGTWNLTHTLTGRAIVERLTETVDGPFMETRTTDFGNVRRFAKWPEQQADLNITDRQAAVTVLLAEPIKANLIRFIDSPESWSAL